MSRRESCVWHPMPEEVRRSSVQSRRASLAAGRRKSMNTNEPDWEVEAPPTPPRGDYTPRDDQPAAAAVAAEPAAAAAAAPVAVAASAPAEQEQSKGRKVSPAQEPEGTEVVQREAPAAAEASEEAAAAAAVAAEEEERNAVASVKSEQLSEASEEKAEVHAEAAAAPEAAGRGRTRHIVRFHGEKWAKVLSKQRADIEAAFLADIKECAGVEAEEAKRLKVKMTDCMEVTFVIFSNDRARQKSIHASLQKYKFPHTCHAYVAYKA